ncbi:MAG: hypothetical protein P8175_00725 [Deltaproteobacteria bacterium]
MESEELVKLMEEVDAKGIGWDKVEEAIKVPYPLLKLYANSGPVPVTLINKLKKFLESESLWSDRRFGRKSDQAREAETQQGFSVNDEAFFNHSLNLAESQSLDRGNFPFIDTFPGFSELITDVNVDQFIGVTKSRCKGHDKIDFSCLIAGFFQQFPFYTGLHPFSGV